MKAKCINNKKRHCAKQKNISKFLCNDFYQCKLALLHVMITNILPGSIVALFIGGRVLLACSTICRNDKLHPDRKIRKPCLFICFLFSFVYWKKVSTRHDTTNQLISKNWTFWDLEKKVSRKILRVQQSTML